MMALSPDLGFAGNVLVSIVCTCNWFNGIIVPYNQIQVFWRYWVRLPLVHSREGVSLTLNLLAILFEPFHLPPRRHGQSRHLRRGCNLLH